MPGPAAHLSLAHHAIAAIHAPSAQRLAIPRTLAHSSAVAITFDDGPHPDGTPAVLEILAAHEARATFFVVGEQVTRRPALVREILSAGHAVAAHGYHHRLQSRRRGRALQHDYARAIAAIEDAADVRPTRHRPPYGIYSPAGLRLARQCGLQPLLWSAWGKDWRALTSPERIAANALTLTGARAGEPIAAGDVLLLHDADFYSADKSHVRTAAALAIILEQLDRRGLGTTTVA